MARPPIVSVNGEGILVSDTNQEIGRKYLEGGHRQGVNVTLLRGVAIFEAKLCRIQQFRSHITDNSRLGSRRAVRMHDGGIGDDPCDSEVSKASVTLFGDQDVSLYKSRIGTRLRLMTSVSYRINVTVHDTL